MAKAHVAVLRGGPSHTYDLSIRTGNEYLTHLDTLGAKAYDIFIDKQGVWHKNGIPTPAHAALQNADVALNTLSGDYGEDGQLFKELSDIGVRAPGSSIFSAQLVYDKARTRHQLPRIKGVHTPQAIVFHGADFKNDVQAAAHELFTTFGPPYVIKPLRGSASLSVVVCRTIPEVIEALELAFIAWDAVIIEEYIRGTEVTCGVVEGLRDTNTYVLPPVEIRPPNKSEVLTYDTKFAHSSEYIAPTTLSYETKQLIEAATKAIHNDLRLGAVSRTDFKVHPSGRVYFIETNIQPEIAAQSPFGTALDAVGVSMPQVIEHLITHRH